jgi:hypothetical protein
MADLLISLYKIFSHATGADQEWQKEPFLEQTTSDIETGKLRIAGYKFSITFDSRGKPIVRIGLPSDEPPALVEISRLAMANHQLIFGDWQDPCRHCLSIVQGTKARYSRMSGWYGIHAIAGDAKKLWAKRAAAREPPISEDDLRGMLQIAVDEKEKEPGKVFGVRDARIFLKKTGRPYDDDTMRIVLHNITKREPGRPRTQGKIMCRK